MNREAENIEMTDNDVASVVSGLSTVKAPAGFERQVMTRIAEGAPRSSWFAMPVLAYAVPALIVLLIATFLIFRSRPAVPNEQNSLAEASQSAVQSDQNAPVTAPPTPESFITSQPRPEIAQKPSPSTAPPSQRQPRANAPNVASVNSNSGKVITIGQGQTQTPMPEGISPRPQRRTAEANSIISTASVPVEDIFGIVLGISAKYDNGWTVTSISANGGAMRSGIKVGDVITAINDRQLSSNTTYKGSGNLSTITVRRGGETLLIKLK